MRVLISSLIGLILSIIIAPKYGAFGCAAATGMALVLTQILYIDFYQRKMGLNMGCFFKNCHVKIMPLIVIYAIVSFFICHNLIINNWLILFVVIGVYTLGYLTIAWFFLANNYEKELVLGFVHKRNNR
jgi:peptidoglycan biosynthesis protein MviN/MurJ (putative lipid II flippase)